MPHWTIKRLLCMLLAMNTKLSEGDEASLGSKLVALAAASISLCAGFGCRTEPTMPAPIAICPQSQETTFAFDTNGDRRPDFWQYERTGGRKDAIAYGADNSSRPGERIDLDRIKPADVPHFVIVLDGVPFELVDELYHQGYFRFFHPPARVICPFPGMTDTALTKVFHSSRCIANQALYFDRPKNRLSDGNGIYLSGRNAPWAAKMTYRCSFWWDGLSYLDPQLVFDHEMNGIVDAFGKVKAGEAFTYSIGSAALGIRYGRPAFLDFLRTTDRLCEQILYARHGRAKITLVSDHGHCLVECRPISFDKVLSAGGYRLTKSINGPRDVVAIPYGLCTYAELYTNDPAGVAGCVLGRDDVELACYAAGDAVVVRDREGEARILNGKTGFVYDVKRGDPLKLRDVIERLRRDGKVSADGEIDGPAMFAATVDQYYPDPLPRVWEAFHGLVDTPPDVLVSLRDGSCFGSQFFYAMIGKVGSTHGSLSRRDSTAFVMTTLGDLPPAMRSSDVLPALERLRSGK
jgi:hypothetical protein